MSREVQPADCRMLIAVHKLAPLPNDPIYLPVHVGNSLSPLELGYQSDADGENISFRNESYCELTAMYWAWKNLTAPVIGLSHYRRYFRGTASGPRGRGVLSGAEMSDLMSTSEVVLSRPRNYLVESVESHYRHGHFGSDLDVVRTVLRGQDSSYLPAFEAVMRSRRLSLYNMFLMRRPQFDAYCSWLFPILEATDSLINNEARDQYQRRTFGYLGERLLNVWVQHHAPDLRVDFVPVVNTDGEPKLAKGAGMLVRKLRPKNTA